MENAKWRLYGFVPHRICAPKGARPHMHFATAFCILIFIDSFLLILSVAFGKLN